MEILSTNYSTLKNIPAVYIFRNIINDKFYIGETLGLKRRMEEYKYPLKGADRLIHRAINKHGIDNFSLEYHYLPDFSKKDLIELEESMIKRYNSLTPFGYNVSPKGGSYEGGKTSEELKLLRRTFNTKEIHQYDALNGDYIKTYFSLEEAARQINGNASNITFVANGTRKTAHGFIWSYEKKDKVNPVKAVGITHSKIVRQHTLDGEIINTFDTLHTAAKFISGNHNHICNVCNGKMKTYYGYKWSYA